MSSPEYDLWMGEPYAVSIRPFIGPIIRMNPSTWEQEPDCAAWRHRCGHVATGHVLSTGNSNVRGGTIVCPECGET